MHSTPLPQFFSSPPPKEEYTLARRALWFFILLHVLVWTLIPNGVRTMLPMDALEGNVWGLHFHWGYDRNPWLNGWLTRLAVELGGQSDIFVYLLSQLCVALAFWSIWRLGSKMLSPFQAVVSVLMLEAIQYYTLAAVDFNDNVLELGLWPLLVFLFYEAITRQRCRDWLGVGLIAGFAMMTKYYAIVLFLAMFAFLVWHPKARKSFQKQGLYWSALLFVAIITPHVIWLFQHDFVTMRYALGRVHDNQHMDFWHYIAPGISFGTMQVVTFLGAVALASVVWLRPLNLKKLGRGVSGESHTTAFSSDGGLLMNGDVAFNRQFLWFVGVGPYLITVLLALLAGWQLYTLWGTPLLGCWGVILLYYLQPVIKRVRFYCFLAAVLIVFSAFIGGYTFVMLKPGNTSSGNFPGRAFAEEITAVWHARYKEPLAYVVGDRVLSGSVTRYSPDEPQAHLDWNSANNPWIDEKTLRRKGAIFLQKLNEGDDFPAEIRKRFPDLKIEGIHYMRYVRPAADSTPIAVLVGVLPAEY